MSESLDVRAKRVFDQAIDLLAAERGGYLAQACGDDAALRSRVETLLAASEREDGFLERPTLAPAAVPASSSGAELPGMSIGPYRLIEAIGEGGFGSVFLAEQEHPVKRRVALKIIKLGMDTRSVVARFEQERQALALMDHPNIARVLDAGTTQTGRPYFVMEYVRGEAITTYCDRANLSISERLGLFTQVCRAVQHAHTKGVIHRDIKPSNVLVCEQDGRPFSRVIDFGIAKATQRPFSDHTIFTEARQLVGTPEYMSPEQAGGDRDIDTRTDVYSLGVLLYELLTGATPFDPRRLRSAAFGELQRIIRETDPPAPSTRVAASADTLAGVAAVRRVEPRKLGSMIRGELDWIVMRAMDKERARRYDSPGNLAADIDRFLAGSDVEAAPPSFGYRLRKVLRRHRVGTAAAAAIALSLMLGLGAAVWQARLASRERDRAVVSELAAKHAQTESDRRRQEVEKIAEFQQAQLEGIDPEAMGKQIRDRLIASSRSGLERQGVAPGEIDQRQEQLSRLLDAANPTDVALGSLDENIFSRALHAADVQFKDQPLIKAQLLQSLGATMTNLGLADRAIAPQREALAIRKQLLGSDDPATIASMSGVGEVLLAQSKFSDAESVFRESMDTAARVLGQDGRLTLEARNGLGIALQAQGKRTAAATLFRDALPKFRTAFGPDAPQTLQVINNLGGLLMDDGKPGEAEPYFREALELRRRVSGETDIDTVLTMNNLALSLEKQGKPAEAEPLYREALTLSRKARGDDHPDSLLYQSNLGFVLCTLGQIPAAEQMSREALQRRRAKLGSDNPDTLQSAHNLGIVLLAAHRPVEGETLLREAETGRARIFGVDSKPARETRSQRLKALVEMGRQEEAVSVLVQAEHRLADPQTGSAAGRRATVRQIVAMLEDWEKADSGHGHGAQAQEWKAILDGLPDPAAKSAGSGEPKAAGSP